MFEILITRRDFTEEVATRHATHSEAQEAARLICRQQPDLVVRTWIRQVRPAPTKN